MYTSDIRSIFVGDCVRGYPTILAYRGWGYSEPIDIYNGYWCAQTLGEEVEYIV